MPPPAEAEAVPHREVVAARVRAGDRRLAREVPGDAEARESRIALDLEVRTEVAQRRGGVVHAAAELPHEREAELVDGGGADRPGIGEVDVVLAPLEVAVHPGDVPAERERLRVGARLVEVAE